MLIFPLLQMTLTCSDSAIISLTVHQLFDVANFCYFS